MANGWGGKRAGSGRKPGSANRKSRAVADKAAAEGITPLEVMLDTMRGLWGEAVGKDGKIKNHDQALAACAVAKDAAPYMHPRMQQIAAEINQTVTDTRAAELKSDLEIIEMLRAARAEAGDPPTVN